MPAPMMPLLPAAKARPDRAGRQRHGQAHDQKGWRQRGCIAAWLRHAHGSHAIDRGGGVGDAGPCQRAELALVQERLQAGALRPSIARELRKQLAVIEREIAEFEKEG
jgi:hypothetical protein